MAKLISVPQIQLQLGRSRIRIDAKKGHVWCQSSEEIVKVCGLKNAELLEDFVRHTEFRNIYTGKFEKYEFWSIAESFSPGRISIHDRGGPIVTVQKFIREEMQHVGAVRRVK